jgi:transposase
VARSKNGQIISPHRRTPAAKRKLRGLAKRSQSSGDLATWRRAHAVLGYIEGKTVIALCGELDVVRASVNRWLQWYEASGLEGLKPRKAPGAAPRLSEEQRAELAMIVEAGPQEAGFLSGVWTGPMIGALIRERYGVGYHNHHIPRLLHGMGFCRYHPSWPRGTRPSWPRLYKDPASGLPAPMPRLRRGGSAHGSPG